jgi:hypothetical protein
MMPNELANVTIKYPGLTALVMLMLRTVAEFKIWTVNEELFEEKLEGIELVIYNP